MTTLQRVIGHTQPSTGAVHEPAVRKSTRPASKAEVSSHAPAQPRVTPPSSARRSRETLEAYTRRFYRQILLDAAKVDPAAALAKAEKMSADAHACFRGSLAVYRELIFQRYPHIAPVVAKNASLAARDVARTHRMTVLGNNDAHVYNYGVTLGLVDGKRRPVFGGNDFDETAPVPFACDLLHDGVSRTLEARALGLSEKKSVEELVDGYEDTLKAIAEDPRLASQPLTADNAPSGPVRDLLKKAEKANQEKWLARRMDTDSGLFHESFFDDSNVHCPERLSDVQESLNLWLQSLPQGAATPTRVEVADVVYRRFSGTASLERLRLHASVQLTFADGSQSRHLVELKEERPATYNPTETREACASRAAASIRLMEPHGDPLVGHTTLGRMPMLVRERNAYRMAVDQDDVHKARDFNDYAEVCGGILARQHAAQNPQQTAQRLLDSVAREDVGQPLTDFVVASARELGDYFETRAYPLFKEVFADLRPTLESSRAHQARSPFRQHG